VRYPIVDYREVEIEPFGPILTFDKPKEQIKQQQRYTIEYVLAAANWFVEVGHE